MLVFVYLRVCFYLHLSAPALRSERTDPYAELRERLRNTPPYILKIPQTTEFLRGPKYELPYSEDYTGFLARFLVIVVVRVSAKIPRNPE